jgi:hypothetical protein
MKLTADISSAIKSGQIQKLPTGALAGRVGLAIQSDEDEQPLGVC